MKFFLGQKLSMSDIQVVYNIFISLIPFYVILGFESPLVNIITVKRDSLKIIKINVYFILTFYSCSFLLKNTFGIYTIPASLMVAQGQSFVLYAMNVQTFFKQTTD